MIISSYSKSSIDFPTAFNAAFNELNKGALGAWFYIYTQHPKELNAEEAMKIIKISRASFYNGVLQLQAKKYLNLQPDGSYAFIPVK